MGNLSCVLNKMEGQAGGKRSMWMSHVKKTMKANKGKTLMEVLKMAKKTYKKSMKGGAEAEDVTPLPEGTETTPPAMGGRRRKTRKNKKSRKSRKGGMKSTTC